MKFFAAFFALMFGGLPLVFIGIGYHQSREQHHKISSYLPVEAQILSKTIDSRTSTDSDGHTSTTYAPVVNYRYQVGNQSFSSGSTLPLNMSSSRKWAEAIVARYNVGGTAEAYYNPDDPSDAFLERQYTFFPYVFMLFPSIFLVIAIAIVPAMWGSKTIHAPKERAAGMYEILPAANLAGGFKKSFIAFGIWHVYGLWAYGHYFMVASPPYGTFAYIATGVYLVLGFIPGGLALRNYLLARTVSDARIFVHEARFVRGQEIGIHFEQMMRQAKHIEDLQVGLICEQTTRRRSGNKTSISTDTFYEDWTTLYKEHAAQRGEGLINDFSITVPNDRSASSPPGQKDYPRFGWKLAVKLRMDEAPDYTCEFPIEVNES